MSSDTNKALVPSLILVSATLLFPAGNAAAEDFLQHQRELLAGRPPAVSTPLNAPRSAEEASSTGDAQELARRLLRGVQVRSASEPQPGPAPTGGLRVYGDAQLLAQHLLAGGHAAPAAGS